MENPRHLLARGEEVSLTKEDLKRLRQEIEEQESLIKGYQVSLLLLYFGFEFVRFFMTDTNNILFIYRWRMKKLLKN